MVDVASRPSRARSVPNQSLSVKTCVVNGGSTPSGGIDVTVVVPAMWATWISVSTPTSHIGATCQLYPVWKPPNPPLLVSGTELGYALTAKKSGAAGPAPEKGADWLVVHAPPPLRPTYHPVQL